MWEDILNFVNDASLIRAKAKKEGIVNLLDFPEVPTFEIPESYIIKEYNFPSENYANPIRNATGKISNIAEKKGCGGNFFTALYEAALNAHQHGNKCDPNKKVTFAYCVQKDKIRTAVIDQGGILEPDFLPFLTNLRLTGNYKNKFHNYYDFAKTNKSPINNGTGTSFMHAYIDDVSYLKSQEGGLVVYLTKSF